MRLEAWAPRTGALSSWTGAVRYSRSMTYGGMQRLPASRACERTALLLYLANFAIDQTVARIQAYQLPKCSAVAAGACARKRWSTRHTRHVHTMLASSSQGSGAFMAQLNTSSPVCPSSCREKNRLPMSTQVCLSAASGPIVMAFALCHLHKSATQPCKGKRSSRASFPAR